MDVLPWATMTYDAHALMISWGGIALNPFPSLGIWLHHTSEGWEVQKQSTNSLGPCLTRILSIDEDGHLPPVSSHDGEKEL